MSWWSTSLTYKIYVDHELDGMPFLVDYHVTQMTGILRQPQELGEFHPHRAGVAWSYKRGYSMSVVHEGQCDAPPETCEDALGYADPLIIREAVATSDGTQHPNLCEISKTLAIRLKLNPYMAWPNQVMTNSCPLIHYRRGSLSHFFPNSCSLLHCHSLALYLWSLVLMLTVCPVTQVPRQKLHIPCT